MHISKFTDNDYKALFDYQLGICELCGKQKKELVVDFDRKFGKVRGLLCHSCFRGRFSKSREFLLKVSNYLLNPVADRVFGPK